MIRIDQSTLRIVQASEKVLLLTNEGRHGGAFDEEAHLTRGGAQSTFDDFDRDGIEVHDHAPL